MGEHERFIVRYMKHFEAFGNISPGSNSSYITIVPKVKDLITQTYYKPISLINHIYKIVAKIITNRFKGIIG